MSHRSRLHARLLPGLALISWLTLRASAAPVINELMYHPLSSLGNPEDVTAEWIEVHNADTANPVDVSGWKFTRGVSFTIANPTVIPAGGYLVIAADVAKFQTDHPGYAGLLRGGWTGSLASGGEQVQLEDGAGIVIDDVTYSDEGDWATRVRGPLSFSHRGWMWETGADGGGTTIELRNPLLGTGSGQNWAVSAAAGGTPGAANSAASTDIAPLIKGAQHKPEIPRSTDAIRFSCTIEDEMPGATATLHWRVDGAPSYNTVTMIDANADGDLDAQIVAQANLAVIEWYISATDGTNSRTWPAPARTSNPGVLPETFDQVTNALLQVDDSFNPAVDFTVPGNQPVYRLLMTNGERAELAQIGSTAGEEDSVAQMNGTFLSHDGTGTKVRYHVGIRNRGQSSASGPPNNYHVSFLHSDRWSGRASIALNCQYPYSQALGQALFQQAGIASQESAIVRVRVNGDDPAESGSLMYGRYVRLEGRGGDWAEHHYPQDPDGNFYRLDDHVYPQNDPRSGEFRYEGTDPGAYSDTFIKETNQEANDFSDLVELSRIVSAPVSGGTVEQPAVSDAAYPSAVAAVLDIDQAFRFFAVDALIGNQEGGLQSGRADDASIYRGVADPRFRFIPHDLDDIFDIGNSVGNPLTRSIFSPDGGNTPGTGVLGLTRLFNHPQLAPRYYAAVLDALDTWFNNETIDPIIDQIMTNWVPATNGGTPPPRNSIAEIKAYIGLRRANVLGQIQRVNSLTVTTAAPDTTEGYKQTTTGAAQFSGTFNVAKTYSITVNGALAQWFYRPGGGNNAGTWNLSVPAGGGAVLSRGLNKVVVAFHSGVNGTGAVLESLTANVFYSVPGTGTTTGGTLTPPGSLTLLAPASYIPGVPVMVRVDLKDSLNSLDRTAWNRTVTLSGSNGVSVNPSSITLTNGMGSALVIVGGGGSVTTQTLFSYGTGGTGTAGSGTPGSQWKSRSNFTTTTLAAFIAGSGTTWMNEGFDDSAWTTVNSQAGYGDGDENTPIPDPDYDPGVTGSQNVPCYLFRSTFSIDDISAVTSVTGQVKYDDAYRLYVNGVKIANSSGLGDAVALNQYATANGENSTANITVPLANLHNGVNTVAVEIHQDAANSSDVTFDLRLTASTSAAAPDPGNFTLTATQGSLTAAKAIASLGTAPAMTTVSGSLPAGETTWSGVINVTGDVTVPTAATLNIAPGTHILMAGTSGAGSTTGSNLIVQTGGIVNAAGTLALPVSITAADPATRWGEINTGGATTTWNYCLVSRACHSPGGGHTGTGPCFRLGNGAIWTFDDGVIADLPGKTLTNTGNTTMTMRRSHFARCVMGPEIDGSALTIEDCNFTDMLPAWRESGAADDEDCIYIHDSGGRPVNLRRSVFANSGDDGIDLLAGGVTVEDCIIRNILDKGMSLLQNNVTVLRTQIIDCDFCVSCKTQIGSEATTYTLNLENCTLVGEAHPTNQGDQTGGVYWHSVGVHVRNKYGTGPNAQLVVNAKNCIISAITPMLNDYATAGVDHPLTTVSYDCFQDVAGTNPVDPAPPSGTGTILADPLFTGAAGKDFHLSAASPARDTGDPASPLDTDGSRADMGALPYAAPVTGGGTVVWTAAGSPYHVTSDVIVPASFTLRMDPGVSVDFAAGVRILVQGAIQIEGTADRPVILSHVPGSAFVPDTVLNGSPPAPPHWAGIRIEGPGPNVIRHAHFINAQGTRAANNGSVGVFNSSATIEYCSFTGTHLRMIYSSASSMIIRFNRFADMFAANEAADALGLDNISEHVKSDNKFPLNGWFLVQGNVFGINKGHNDVIDVGSNRRPNAIAQIRDNNFAGVGDEQLDLDGDFLITGNLFRKILKDDETSDRGYASGVSTSDFRPATMAVIARNFFWEVDHAINLKEDATALFEHNTCYKVNGDFVDRFGNENIGSIINLFIDENGPASGTGGAYPGTGAYAGHNIFYQIPRIFGNVDPNANAPELPADWTHHIEFDYNLVDPAMTDFSVGVRHPGSVMTYGPGNQLGAAMFRDPDNGDFSLLPASPAIGASPFGQDFGALVPDTVWVRANVPALTGSTSAGFLIGGPGMFGYKYRLDGGAWSAEAPIGNVTNILIAGSDTSRTATLNLSSLAAGPHTLEVIGRDFADVWQPESAPTTVTWTVDPVLSRLVISEVLAENTNAHDNGGTFPDYIEICNEGAAAVDLAGYQLSDDPLLPGKFVFPSTVLSPGACVLVYADGPAATPGLHANFSLKSSDGEQVVFSAPAAAGGAVLDSLIYGIQIPNYSVGRTGRSGTWLLNLPTPGVVPNVEAHLGAQSSVLINEWLTAGGVRFDDDWIELANTATLPVSLTGMTLTDAPLGVSPPFPALSFIAPGGFVKIIADGNPGAGANHVDFRMDNLTDEIALFDSAGNRIDIVLVGPQTEDVSQGRAVSGGTGGLAYYVLPTSGFANGTGDPGYANALAILNGLRITEIMYNPAGGNSFEFIELTNTGSVALDLGGVVFFNGIDFTFPPGYMLAPGAQTVLVRNLAAFESRYGTGVNVAGVYTGALDNNGERLALRLPDPWHINVLSFRYESTWQNTNGSGLSLVLITNSTLINEFDDRDSWTTGPNGGTPAGSTLPGHDLATWLASNSLTMADLLLDGDNDGLTNLVEYSFSTNPASPNGFDGIPGAPTAQASTIGGEPAAGLLAAIPVSALPGGFGCPGVAYYVEDSDDLVTWREVLRKSPTDADWQQLAGAIPLVESLGISSGRARFLLKSTDSISANVRRHMRMRIVLLP